MAGCLLPRQASEPLSLPPELLSAVLRHLPQQQRLTSAALVSKSWQAAAVAATNCVTSNYSGWCRKMQDAAARSLEAWLFAYGHSLTHVSVNGTAYSFSTTRSCFSVPTQLQDLQLCFYDTYNAACVGPLPSSLTRLALTGRLTDDCHFDFDTTPCLSQLTGLRHLQLGGYCSMQPAVLSGLVHLSFVELHMPNIIRDAEAGCAGTRGKAGMGQLLAALQQLTNLQHLDLNNTLYNLPDRSSSSSRHTQPLLNLAHLTYLGMLECDLGPCDMQLLFGTGAHGTALRELHLGVVSTPYRLEYKAGLAASDLEQLVASCPNLKRVVLYSALQPGVQPTAFSQLTALTSLQLSLNGDPPEVDNSWIEGTLVKLTSLQELIINACVSVDLDGLLQLTQLTQLTRLQCPRPLGVLNAWGSFDFCDLISQASPPDVFQQLRRVIEAARQPAPCTAGQKERS